MQKTGPHFRDVVAALAHGGHGDLIALWLWCHSVDILSFALAALIAYWLERRRGGTDAAHGLLRFALPKESIFCRSAFADYLFVIVPRFIGRETMVPVLIGAFALAALIRPYTAFVFGAYTPAQHATVFQQILFVAGWLLATDFGIYASHWLRHRVPLLWEFHKVHHSAEVLNPITVFREHPIDGFVQDITATLCAGLFMAIFGRFVRLDLMQTTLLGVNAVVLSRLLTMQHLRHSQIALHFPAWLDRILISPVNHQLHHSGDVAHYDRNFGNVFSIWDHLFATFRAAEPGERFRFGLGNEEARDYGHNFAWLLLLPFAKAFALLRAGARTNEIADAPQRAGAHA